MVTVGISEHKIVKGQDTLATYALGSCVGICIIDTFSNVAGLAHILLPSSKSCMNITRAVMGRYADLAIPQMVKEMEAMGANRFRMKAKIAGGASMFGNLNNKASSADIGKKNVESVKQTLRELRIGIIAEDTGKDYGRTQFFDSTTGSMKIKSFVKGEITL